jgi:hypothetical protein
MNRRSYIYKPVVVTTIIMAKTTSIVALHTTTTYSSLRFFFCACSGHFVFGVAALVHVHVCCFAPAWC